VALDHWLRAVQNIHPFTHMRGRPVVQGKAFRVLCKKTAALHDRKHLARILTSALVGIVILVGSGLHILVEAAPSSTTGDQEPLRKKINFISTHDKKRTPNPAGWEAYDGSVYTKERGYGWVTKLTGFYAADGGPDATIYLTREVVTSPRELGRLELANWQGTHRENHPLVFRVDLPDGWYRVACASVGLGVLPVLDQRNFKCRAQDTIFAGPSYGLPLKARGVDLVEGSNIVEITDGQLRIVVGDPAYGGWTWSYKGAWHHGWDKWWGKWGDHRYAETWYQKFTRVIDPGFHSLRLNSLEIERVPAPAKRSALFFRDVFNRDDSQDINSGVAAENRWIKIALDSAIPNLRTELYKTSLKLIGSKNGKGLLGVIQKKPSPERGIVRYSTRVSLFTGEGSKIHSGFQEAGLLILGEATGPTDFNSTFVGIAFDRRRPETPGWVKYRVGNGRNGYKTNLEIPDTSLPFQVTEGEYEIMVDHNVKDNVLEKVRINGEDITESFSLEDRKQRLRRGLFGIRASMDPLGSGVTLQQFYWYYRVEAIVRIQPSAGN
jgi:hypothetical protein